MTDFQPFTKIARLSREIIVTEKIDGTNASIFIGDDGEFKTGSRTRWITPDDDNYGFAKWAYAHMDDLLKLGPGMHYGEWWGRGIQRGYDVPDKRFSLFNVSRWSDDNARPWCCGVVPVLFRGMFDTTDINNVLNKLEREGSKAAPGFMRPEGVVVFHTASGTLFKKTIERDDVPKSMV